MSVGYGGFDTGDFMSDTSIPGLPGLTSSYENAAAEVRTWLDLPAGTITLGVNSDDGFRMSIGGSSPSDQFAVKVGEFDGGRPSGDTLFTFTIAKAGIYAVICTWENSCCGASMEMFSVKSDGSKVLLNDTANGGIKAYRAVTSAARAYAQKVVPSVGAASARGDTPVLVELVDGANPISPTKVKLSVDGTVVKATISKSGNVTTIAYNASKLYAPGSQHTATLAYTEGTSLVAVAWNFGIANYIGPTGNLYESVLVPTHITWPDAKIAAEKRTFLGHQGHLATITTPEEDLYLENLRRASPQVGGASQLWVGGYQLPGSIEPDGGWVWINNEGAIPGQNGGPVYANWQINQPDNAWTSLGLGGENYLAIGLFNQYGWNDDGSYGDGRHDGTLDGYAVEYEAQSLTLAIQSDSGEKSGAVDLNSNGQMGLAIQSSPGFDASTVDPATITFGVTGNEAVPVSSTVKRPTTKGATTGAVLLCQFNIQELGLTCSNPTLLLKGQTFQGYPVKGTVTAAPYNCPEYTLSVQAMQDVHKLTDVYLTCNVIVNNCLAPVLAQHVELASLDLLNHTRWSATANNVPMVRNPDKSSTGDLQYSTLQHHQNIRAKVSVRSCKGDNDLELWKKFTVMFRPDLTISSVDAPSASYTGITFNISALIAELNGDLGATATVYLMEGANVLDQALGVNVGAHQAASVVFTTTFNTVGTHNLKILIGNETPGDYDTSNNSKEFSIEVTQQPAVYYAYYSHYTNEFSEEYNWPWWQSGINYHNVNDENLTEYLYIPGSLSFPLTDVTIKISADGTLKENFDLPNVQADYQNPPPYYYAQAFRHLADGVDFYVQTYNYPGYQQSYAQFSKYAADDVYYSIYHHIYWGDGVNAYTNKFGTYLNAATSVDTRFVIQSGLAGWGGSVSIPVYSNSWDYPFDYEDPSTGYYDRGFNRGSNTYGSSSGYIFP